jgi:DNA-binding NtrC family response regulator
MAQILIVEDEVLLAKSICRSLVSRGHDCFTAVSAEEGLALLEKMSPDVILLDVQLPGMSGLEAIKVIRKFDPNISIIMATAYGTMASVVEAMRSGACDFLRKPLDMDEVLLAIERAIANFRLKQTVSYYQSIEAERTDEDKLVCESPKMKHVGELADKLASMNLENASDYPPILLLGETGVGKDLIARYIHFRGKLSGQPFVEVNCTTLPKGLEEAELFGYEKGSFTGAFRSKRGLFEAATGGTIFLNEIGDLSQDVQVKLLQAIEQKTFRRVGGLRDISANVRIIAATNRDLKNQREFRSDLYYRLNNLTLEVPRLRERKEDIIMLAELFLTKFGKKYGTTKKLEPSARQALLEYAWYGNVRELRQLMERLTFLSSETTIKKEDLRLPIAEKATSVSADSNASSIEFPEEGIDLEEVEKDLILKALKSCGGNISEAARKLGLGREALRYRVKKFSISKSIKIIG